MSISLYANFDGWSYPTLSWGIMPEGYDDTYNPYLNGVVVYCNADGTTITPNNQGSDPVGANSANGYANAEYLIAVEDAENGMLNGQITALCQVSADGNGKVTVPDDIAAGEGEYLNLYGACRHPSCHLGEYVETYYEEVYDDEEDEEDEEDDEEPDEPVMVEHQRTFTCNLCDVCGARLPAIIDCGKQPDAPDNTVGDVNLDGRIDIRDVTAIQRHLAELEPLSGQALALADTNGDGEIDISDATHLQMYLAEYDVVLGKQAA